MDSIEYQKKKKRKEMFRKFVINFFIWLLIIAFVSTLGVYWGKDVNINVIKIVKVGKKDFNYHPGSLFSYVLNFNREKLINFLPRNVDQTTFDRILINYSVESFINNAHIYLFAKQIGLSPSRDITRNIVESSIKGALTRVPEKGLVEYAYMEYANQSLASDIGDIMNALGFVTMSELFSYYDLFSYYAESEFVIFDYTNYISKKITDSELEEYFKKNISNYITEIKVEDIAVNSKEFATEIKNYIKENGFEKAVSNYKNKAKFSIITLTKKSGTAKRFELALKNKEGEIPEKIQFENGEYHIFRIKEMPKFSTLSKEIKSDLLNGYLLENKDRLISKYKPEIDNLINNVSGEINRGKSLKDISSYLSSPYYKSSKVIPVSRYIYSDDKKVLPINTEDNPEVLETIFTSDLNKINIINKDKYSIFVKTLSRKIDKNFSYTNINQEVMREYMNYKATAISKDWMKSLEKRYPTIIYTNEIEKLTKGKIEQ